MDGVTVAVRVGVVVGSAGEPGVTISVVVVVVVLTSCAGVVAMVLGSGAALANPPVSNAVPATAPTRPLWGGRLPRGDGLVGCALP